MRTAAPVEELVPRHGVVLGIHWCLGAERIRSPGEDAGTTAPWIMDDDAYHHPRTADDTEDKSTALTFINSP